MKFLRYLASAAPFLLISIGHAETYPDCEKYESPLAYNQCLASHGPSAAHALAAKTEEGVDSADFHAPSAAAHPVHSFRSYRPRGGRMTATFTIQDAHPAYQGGHFRRMR
jgi:hypothetical protein